MEVMLRCGAAALTAAVLGALLRRHTPELALLAVLAAGVWMLSLAADALGAAAELLEELSRLTGMEEELIEQLTLRQAIDSLPQREQMVILLRFYKNLTQDQVSRVLGVSQVQVSRIERKAVNHLREVLSDEC